MWLEFTISRVIVKQIKMERDYTASKSKTEESGKVGGEGIERTADGFFDLLGAAFAFAKIIELENDSRGSVVLLLRV